MTSLGWLFGYIVGALLTLIVLALMARYKIYYAGDLAPFFIIFWPITLLVIMVAIIGFPFYLLYDWIRGN